MIKFFRKLRWLVKHQEDIEKLLKNPKDSFNDGTFSLAGVPENQLKYINQILSENK
jgi:hypothetical protein